MSRVLDFRQAFTRKVLKQSVSISLKMTSNPFATGFGPTATRVFQDGTENRQNPALRKTKRDDIPNVPQTKRAALGTITNQRIQPFRAAKQVRVGHFKIDLVKSSRKFFFLLMVYFDRNAKANN